MSNKSNRSESPRRSDRTIGTTADAASDIDDAFSDSAIDRRTFLSLSAATGTALALPGAATADVRDEPMTDEYEFVVNHTPDEYEAPTIIEFADREALEAFADEYEETPDPERPRPPKAVTRLSPTPAAHAHLTADEVADVLGFDGIERMDFSPGANPWWKIEAPYESGVFPSVEQARNYVSYAETVQGLEHIAAEHPDRVRVQAVSESPGWNNQYTGTDPDPKPVYVAEVAKNVRDRESFDGKPKAVYSLSIHGDERAGVESGCRLIEDLAAGRADEFEPLLEEIALVFLFTNPDGWVSRRPQTEIPWIDDHDTNFQRGNARRFDGQQIDTNRQYPTIGWVNPSFRPAEPDGAPEEFFDLVPDALGIVEHFRGYDNVAFLCDYHGMYTADHMVFNLETNAPFDHDGTHDLDEVNRRIGEGMQAHWGDVDAIADDIATAGEERYGTPFVPTGDSFDGLFDWGSIYDSLSYQITGSLLGWAGQPEAFGGLGAITVAPEIILSNHVADAQMEWKPYWSRHYVTAYRISMRELAEMTARETSATIATGGQNTAYVTADELTRSSAELPHTDGAEHGHGQDSETTVQRSHDVVHPGPDTQSAVGTETTDETHSLFVHLDGVRHATEGTVRLRRPNGSVVREIDLSAKADPADRTARKHDFEELFVRRPQAGQWAVEVESDVEIRVTTTRLETEGEIPDPKEVLGYEQREYSVDPMQFFADLEPYLEDGWIDELPVSAVGDGQLVRSDSTGRRCDKLVVSHDVGIDNPLYVSMIETFLSVGGDLVLTDTGVNLLGELDVGEAAAIDHEDIHDTVVPFANLENRDFDHPLLAGVRPRQQEVWKGSQLGYTTGVDQPATVVDIDAFEDAGGNVAGTFTRWTEVDGTMRPVEPGVGAGMLSAGDSEIAVLGSVLPPAQQTELHPFGMADYAVSFMGHTLVCNALGFEQRRYVDGELVRTYGDIR
ncbi:M14 family metallopeptidase [Halopiger djelfimassiliensis]|uniref:M14 family metallopeptidase n=1 Tax=Halopiger djelfimassiliensis TaxID=1293047 RepID=UPI0006781A99|nr:M14 family metallopeptidase [Halopiger djelfimassiliensis]